MTKNPNHEAAADPRSRRNGTRNSKPPAAARTGRQNARGTAKSGKPQNLVVIDDFARHVQNTMKGASERCAPSLIAQLGRAIKTFGRKRLAREAVIHPGMAEMAKWGGCKERQARKNFGALRDAGVFIVTAHAKGGHCAPRFAINLTMLFRMLVEVGANPSKKLEAKLRDVERLLNRHMPTDPDGGADPTTWRADADRNGDRPEGQEAVQQPCATPAFRPALSAAGIQSLTGNHQKPEQRSKKTSTPKRSQPGCGLNGGDAAATDSTTTTTNQQLPLGGTDRQGRTESQDSGVEDLAKEKGDEPEPPADSVPTSLDATRERAWNEGGESGLELETAAERTLDGGTPDLAKGNGDSRTGQSDGGDGHAPVEDATFSLARLIPASDNRPEPRTGEHDHAATPSEAVDPESVTAIWGRGLPPTTDTPHPTAAPIKTKDREEKKEAPDTRQPTRCGIGNPDGGIHGTASPTEGV